MDHDTGLSILNSERQKALTLKPLHITQIRKYHIVGNYLTFALVQLLFKNIDMNWDKSSLALDKNSHQLSLRNKANRVTYAQD